MTVRNFVAGEWRDSRASDRMPVHHPATGEEIGFTPFSTEEEVDDAVAAAQKAFREWRRVPVGDRVQVLWRLKFRFEEEIESLAGVYCEPLPRTV